MQDQLLRALLGQGEASVLLARTTSMVEQARALHALSPVATAAVGRALTATSMMGAMQKDERVSLTLSIAGGGPLGRITTVYSSGAVKGYVEHPHADLPPSGQGKLDVGAAVGKDGFLAVTYDLGLKEPYSGRVRLRSGEIAEDLAWYFTISQQQPSLVSLGVRIFPDATVQAAGGIIVQPLPGCSEQLLGQLETRALLMESMSSLLCAYDDLQAIMAALFGGITWQTLATQIPRWGCDCSRERTTRALISMGRQELKQIALDGRDTQVQCHFCNTEYVFTAQEIGNLMI